MEDEAGPIKNFAQWLAEQSFSDEEVEQIQQKCRRK